MGEMKNGGYSLAIGMVYCFNLMMGAGLLALPKVFAQEGWILGLGGVAVLAFMSYTTVTFIIEAQSVHNALKRREDGKDGVQMDTVIQNKNTVEENNNNNDNNEKTRDKNHLSGVENNSSVDRYEITMKTELGELCNVFLNKIGYTVFYIAFCLYLFGSTSIYAAAVSKSLASIVCKDHESFHSGNTTRFCTTLPGQLSLMQTYRISLALFAVLCCPFAFFTLSKTKVLQLSTMAFRFFALTAMIILAVMKIARKEGPKKPELAVFSKLPDFIGTSIYAFMCQYCIPALVTPIHNKKHIRVAIFGAFCLVVLFCTSILMSASYAFEADEVQDLYTLSFTHPPALKYILELFPVITLGTNFPIITIVLRDNIKNLCLRRPEEEYGFFVRRILFPLIAITPSIVISCYTYDVGLLVGYTGAYAGGIIQYVIPVFLVYNARRKAREVFGEYRNRYASQFTGLFWLVLVMVWYILSLGLVTYSKIKKLQRH